MLVMKIYWPSMRRSLHLLLGTLLFLLISVAANSARPFCYEALTNAFGAQVVDETLAYYWLGLLAVALVLGWLSWRVVDWLLAWFESDVMCDLEKRTFAELQRKDMKFHAGAQTGSLIKQATQFRDDFESIIDLLLYQFTRDFLMIIIAIGTFWWKQPSYALLLAGWVIAFLVMNAVAICIKYPMDKKATKASSDVSGVLGDGMGAIRTVKSYGHEAHQQTRHDAKSDESRRRRWISWLTNILIIGVQGFMMLGFELILIHALIQDKKEGKVGVGDFVFFQSAVANIFFLLWMFGHNLRILFQKFAEAREMAEVFQIEPEVQDAPDATELKVTKGEIEFRNVTYAFRKGQKPQLNKVNLLIKPGETVAIVGETGAGKTTLMNTLLRFIDPDDGQILIDGTDIRTVTQQSLRRHFAVVPQVTDLFNDTILTNLLFARPKATPEEVEAACREARIWGYIQSLKEGLLTEVGERGVKLSGGERQRLALARAILASTDREFLILDEGTSSLDNTTESDVQEALDTCFRGKTKFMIAHRLSTIEHADRIIVMREGTIEETGNHKELLAKKSLYAKLHAGGKKKGAIA